MLKTPLKFIITIALTLGLSISFQSLLAAWQAPTDNPPNDNIDMPINTGPDDQDKQGGLDVAGILGFTTRLDAFSRFSVVTDISTNVYDPGTSETSYSRVNSDSFHTNGLGGGQIYIEGRAIDSNTYIAIGAGLAGGRSAEDVRLGDNNELVVDTDTNSVGIGTINPSSDLKLDVEGKIGATEYCDEDGNNCTAAANIGGNGNYNDLPTGALAGFCRTANWRHLPNHNRRSAILPAILISRGSGRYDCGCESGDWSTQRTGLGYRYNEWDTLYYTCRKN